MERMEINYDILKRPRTVFISSFALTFVYNAFVYLHPSNNRWLFNGSFRWSNFLKFIVIDQFLVESVTIFVLFRLLLTYARLNKLTSVELNLRAMAVYSLKFCPVILSAFFFFNPLTQSIRFFQNEPVWSSSIYQEKYIYSWGLFLIYLAPVAALSIGILAANLFVNYRKHFLQQRRLHENIINALDIHGEVFLRPTEILWFEKIDRHYFAFTEKGRFRLKQNFIKLEPQLNPQTFIKANRAVIVNLNFVKNYSYWENDKYILRLTNDKEFIMPRQRLKYFKENSLAVTGKA